MHLIASWALFVTTCSVAVCSVGCDVVMATGGTGGDVVSSSTTAGGTGGAAPIGDPPCGGQLCPLKRIASDNWEVHDLVGNATHLYWSEPTTGTTESGIKAGHLYRVSVDGGSKGSLVRRPSGPLGLTVDRVLYVAHSGLFSVPLAGGDVETVASGDAAAWQSFAIAGDTVYGLALLGDVVKIQAVPTGGGAPQTIADDTDGTSDLFATPSSILWTERHSMNQLPLGGGPAIVLATLTTEAWGPIVADDVAAYFVSYDRAASIRTLVRVSLSGSMPEPVTELGDCGSLMAADADWIYFDCDKTATEPYTIRRVAKTGGAVETIAELPGQAGGRLILQGSALYFFATPPGMPVNVMKLTMW